MKKILVTFCTILILYSSMVKADAVSSTNSNAATNSNETATTSYNDSTAQQMINRVYAIEKMNKTNLTANQKTQLKGELISIKNQLESRRPHVVFIFTGIGVIVVIILLIILL